MKILIVEDEIHLANSVQMLLTEEGFEVDAVYDGLTGLEYAKLGIYDLLILDVMMPGLDGCALARQVRRNGSGVRILMLTAKSELEDRIAGLNSGADYYLQKPFDVRELLACVHALLRREGDCVNALRFGDLTLMLDTAVLWCGKESIRLSAKEFEIFRMMMASGRSNLPKERILTKVWGFDSEATDNHVEVYVGFLRKKLHSIGTHVRIVTIRNLGYHLEEQA